MAENISDTPWPVPKFHFKVTIGNKGDIAFQEVSGLDTEYDIIEYRAGNSLDFSTVKMPGLKKGSDITLKRGVFNSDSGLIDYFNDMRMNVIARETVIIQLFDEESKPIFTWTLKNAFPVKLSGTSSLGDISTDIALEELVLSHEGLTMDKV